MATTATAISSRTNARVKQLRAAFAGQERLSGGLLAIEGEHLIEEALRSGVKLQTIFLTERQRIPAEVPRSVEVVHLTSEVFASAAETHSPQGIAALIAQPVYKMGDILERQISPMLILAAGLQDPGNLGTIIRSAEAFGANGVLTTPGTVSPWNQKALRASAGSAFRMPVLGVTRKEIAALQATHGIRLFAAVSAAEAGIPAARNVDLRQPHGFLIGNEGAGLTSEWLELAEQKITIPCPGPVESLNAAIAASLLLYEASRQRSGISNRNEQAIASPRIPGPLRRRPTGANR
jgi:TrmH family RNA methyltransferase